MKIGVIDADLMDNGTRHPNLALMKIAGYYLNKGDDVKLIYSDYIEIKNFDKVFISKVFSFTKIPNWVFEEKNIEFGGTGFFDDGGTSLPFEIEHHKPYYDLYLDYVNEMVENGKKRSYYSDYLDYSIGFSTRGCFRKCSFCVNKKYDKVHLHSPISEFYDETRPYIYLWDDNILAYPKWEEVLDELESTNRLFQFRQGIDLRLMTERMAYRFNNSKWHGDFIFAFDHLKDRELIIKKVQLWKRYTNKNPKMYVLSAFESQDEVDIVNVFERIKILMKYGSIPYIMRYELYSNSRFKGMYIQLARWCNQPQFYKKMSFREFCERNQYYHLNPNTHCLTYRVMLEFQEEFPNIANKYFDLKYSEENIYNVNYGFGQKYYNKPECSSCIKNRATWNDIVHNNIINKELLRLYLEREINLRCLKYTNAECNCDLSEASQTIIDLLLESTVDESIECIEMQQNKYLIKADELLIPIYSYEKYIKFLEDNFKIDTSKEIIIKDYFDLNQITKLKEKNKLLDMIKFLAVCDFIYYSRKNKNGYIQLSEMGIKFLSLNLKEQLKIFSISIYRLPIIQLWIRNEKNIEKTLDELKIFNINNIEHIDNYLKSINLTNGISTRYKT